MSTKVLYPGSFDPITNGHLDIIVRAGKIFDEVYVAVLNNVRKQGLFTVDERLRMIEDATSDLQNVHVISFDGLTIEVCKKLQCRLILRGLRAVSDYENEMQMALANRKLNADIETVFFVSEGKYSFLSSSTIREIAYFGGSVEGFLPTLAQKMIHEKFQANY